MDTIVYINDLRMLPNFGCRTTGSALEEMLSVNWRVVTRDGRETVANSGWDAHCKELHRVGRGVPSGIANRAWKYRYKHKLSYQWLRKLDKCLGCMHDYVADDPDVSVKNFHAIKNDHTDLRDFEEQVNNCNAVVINGEGTLILSDPMMRDAKYLLFVINYCKSIGKPVFLLNAMVTPCPYQEPTREVIDLTAELLRYCSKIACRESVSYDFVAGLIGENTLELIPDALFTWGEKFRGAAVAVRQNPGLCIPFQSPLCSGDLNFAEPYICVSASSSAWRFGKKTLESLVLLVKRIQVERYKVYLVETCAGDHVLQEVSRLTGAPHISQDIPVIAGGGILAGASAYITGRYHPAIMAAAGGVPTIFMSSNSHKTRSLQTLLGYDSPIEYPIAASSDQIDNICRDLQIILSNRNELSAKILENFKIQAEKAFRYASVVSLNKE